MKRWYRDLGLEVRMLLTFFLLAVVYLFFIAVLAASGVDRVFLMVFIGIFIFVQYYFSDKIALRSMGARIVSESEAPMLHQTISRLCAIADLPKPRVAIVNTDMPNAFATGRNQKSAVVAVTTGIMRTLNQGELEAVLAHELTHIKNRDVMVITIASFLSSVASMIAQNFFFFGGGRDDRDSGNIWMVFLVSVVVWILSTLLILALSRYREFSADRGSALITGQPSHLVSALMKISGQMSRVPKEDLRRAEGMNAFFIMPAISNSIMNLLSTHPSMEARIEALQRMERVL